MNAGARRALAAVAMAAGAGLMGGCDEVQSRWQSQCDQGELVACVNLGEAQVKVSREMSSLTRAAALYRKACDGGEVSGCRMLALAYVHGQGVVQDREKGVQMLTEACDRRDSRSCEAGCELGQAPLCLGVAALASVGGKDLQRAAHFFRKACSMGNVTGCSQLAAMPQAYRSTREFR